MTDLTGRHAVVTGGASGIGRAIGAAFAAAGARVTIADRDAAAAEDVAAQIGGEAWVVDFDDTTSLDGLSLDADILVNNAGMQVINPIQDFDPQAWRRMHRVLLEAPFLLIRASLPHMYANNWGRVINISSVHGIRASAYKSSYVAAKHGLEGLSKVTALEGGPHGVTSNCINPSYVRTPLVENQIESQAKVHGIPPEDVVEKIMLTECAVKRLVEPEEVAALALFLSSEEAGMVTGSSYLMDGGWSSR